ncbi:MAG: (d)CMP kinase [Gemmatimonadaceae bacterium]
MTNPHGPPHSTPPFSPRVRPPGAGVVVAIDGPAASGKSSTAQWVARRLRFRHIDSGALYRAATAAVLRRHESVKDQPWTEADVLDAAHGISLRPQGESFAPTLEDGLIEEEIRDANITRHVSRVAQMPRVREWVNEKVRLAAESKDVVVDGRDIGTVVFPDADVKIFLIADPWERARRRLTQRRGHAPSDQNIAEETERLIQRDARDSIQTIQAKDALVIDTTYLTQEEQVERIVAVVQVVTRRPGDTSSH